MGTQQPYGQFKNIAQSVLCFSIVFTLIACGSNGSGGSGGKNEAPELSTFFIYLGLSLEGVNVGPPPPYKYKPDNEKQRFSAISGSKVSVVNGAGEKISSRDSSGINYGAVYLEHPSDGDYNLIFGSNGKSVCPLKPDDFCQILDLPGNVNTTDVKYLREADGSKSRSTAVAVKAGNIELVSPAELGGYNDSQIFAGTNLPDASENLVSYDSISPTTGIGASEDGIVYFIDTDEAPSAAVKINSNSVGTDIRDVSCENMGSGTFACGVQSYTDKKLSVCVGADAMDFECSATVDVGDGVSIGVAKTAAGNIAVVSTGLSDGNVYLTEFTPALGLVYNGSVSLSDFSEEHFGITLSMPQLGHAAIDSGNNSFMLTGYDTGDLAHILFDDFVLAFKEIEQTDQTPAFGNWFQF